MLISRLTGQQEETVRGALDVSLAERAAGAAEAILTNPVHIAGGTK